MSGVKIPLSHHIFLSISDKIGNTIKNRHVNVKIINMITRKYVGVCKKKRSKFLNTDCSYEVYSVVLYHVYHKLYYKYTRALTKKWISCYMLYTNVYTHCFYTTIYE
jgi:hypothetical protein